VAHSFFQIGQNNLEEETRQEISDETPAIRAEEAPI
jgi:hypothetical protein